MRCWRTPDGRLLVEGPAERPGPGDLRIEDAHVYYLLAPDGRLQRSFEGGDGAFDDEMYLRGHFVKDGTLYSAYRSVHDGGRRSSSDSPVIAGLREVDSASAPADFRRR